MDCRNLIDADCNLFLNPVKWRRYMAGKIAEELDFALHDVRGVYLIGSVENGEAGRGSDIDLVLHIGPNCDRLVLGTWLDGWDRALRQLNYLVTGLCNHCLLDAHFVTDEDIARRTSFATCISSVYAPAEPLRRADCQ